MRVPVTTLAVIIALLATTAIPVAARETGDLFCVQVSAAVDPEDLNDLVVNGEVEVRVIPLAECAPASSPPAAVAERTPFLEYVLHAVAVGDEHGRLFERGSEALRERDLAELESVLDEQIDLAESEVAWLASRPPTECYQAVHAEWRSINEDIVSANRAATRGFEDLDADVLTELGQATMAVGARLKAFGEMLSQAVTDCMGEQHTR
jgi:hypothetical protein